ncbi:MAG TPA: HD domain-containing phosphohydrolase [Chloroflexia bacterium]|nr:HD domain-containing phosphohydrolase [Chloroflexia bacterium]
MAIRPELCALLGSSVADMTDAPPDDDAAQVILPDETRTFQALFEYAPDAMWIFDDAGRYILANAAACALHCLPAAELRRHVFADFVSPGAAAALHLGWPGTAALTQTHGECRLRRPDGTVREVEIHVTAHFQPGRHLAVARDVTARTRAQERAGAQLARLSALRTVDQSRATTRDLRVILQRILDQAVQHLHVHAAAILLFDPVGDRLSYAAGRGFRRDPVTGVALDLPHGYATRAARERTTIYIPQLSSANVAQAGPLAAVEGFQAYWAVPLRANGQVQGVLELFHRAPIALLRDELDFLAALADRAAIAIDTAGLFVDLQRTNQELALAYDTTLEGWCRALDLRDRETEGHTQRVTELTVRLARVLNVPEHDLVHLRRGALLHDIGKMGIPDSILLKPGPLTADEWDVMRRHPGYAHDLLAPSPFLRPALDIPYCHHERWDGSGYPRGLQGAQIPWAARIFAVVDVWDALRSDRPYRPAWSEAQVRDHLESLAGIHFDPRVVATFLDRDLAA